ncbi:TPA: hypothetical protein ACG05V_005422 [Bacillus pacificus]|uniref:hypothetical protein n=1 Tax=Bacillus TaxID=1386 RepID=UPI00027CCB95|nr:MULTISPECIES: hypothetical protein [unclassified Bacillus cereus group]AFQ13309.1 hypothetical protein BCK_27503 [Bacillus cereus FRI-35]MDX5841077.1 hypothetical protein [Bacillus cereus group sp. BfR-BA-01700]MDX5846222.1 hypothetical protein [Bacillus cereus group sp. BfR-BA-01233]MDX5941864.1 hypothetical protein [Bacillus cereus group sp. BfR-BA-00415]
MIEINEDRLCIRNGEVVDFECYIDNLRLYILVCKDKFLPYVHVPGEGFKIAKRLLTETKVEIQDFIEQQRKEFRLQSLFGSADYGHPGISSYLSKQITRDKFDHMKFLLEESLLNETVRFFEIREFFQDLDVEHKLTIKRIYFEGEIQLKFYTVKKDSMIPSFSPRFGNAGEFVGELVLYIELLGTPEDREHDLFILRGVEEVREVENDHK